MVCVLGKARALRVLPPACPPALSEEFLDLPCRTPAAGGEPSEADVRQAYLDWRQRFAEEYLAEGAVHVFAFGPWLIRDGKINPDVQKPGYYPASEPRVAVGMIEPYHYVIIAASGRPKSKYAGAKLLWLAETMHGLGCTEALNLDGGATVVMAFNNKIILQGDNNGKRNIGSLIAFGLKGGPEEGE